MEKKRKEKKVQEFVYMPKNEEKKLKKEIRKLKDEETKLYQPSGGTLDDENPPQSGSGVPDKPPEDSGKSEKEEK